MATPPESGYQARMWLLLAGCVHALPPTMAPDERVPIVTDDGWSETLRHYRGDGPPVLLVHGMGANHYNWDFRPEVSLADALRRDGWDVWVADLRGDQGTIAPSRHAARHVDFDDYAEHDVPAAVQQVLAQTGQKQLYWVGHSLGGMLLYTWLSQHPETVAAGTAICSPSTFQAYEPDGAIRRLGWVVHGGGYVPERAFTTITRPLGRHNPLWGRLANRDNLDWSEAWGLSRVALSDIPRPVGAQAMNWIRTRTLTRLDGQPWVEPSSVPLLVLGAGDDHVVAERDVAATCDVFSDCTYKRLSIADGFSVDYGHIDAVLGRTAPAEVWPLVLGFLDDHRPGAGQVVSVREASAEP